MEKKKRVVIALGGNALGNTLPEQMQAVKITARAIVDLIEDGCEVVVSHGNGPQVGMVIMVATGTLVMLRFNNSSRSAFCKSYPIYAWLMATHTDRGVLGWSSSSCVSAIMALFTMPP